MSLATFLWVHSNSKEVSYLPWQNKCSNLKTSYIKPKFFLWTKLPKHLHLAKYSHIFKLAVNSLWEIAMAHHHLSAWRNCENFFFFLGGGGVKRMHKKYGRDSLWTRNMQFFAKFVSNNISWYVSNLQSFKLRYCQTLACIKKNTTKMQMDIDKILSWNSLQLLQSRVNKVVSFSIKLR